MTATAAKRATTDAVRRAAAKVGGCLDESADGQVIVDAPAGYVWRATDAAIANAGVHRGQSRGEALSLVLADVRDGLRLATPAEVEAIENDRDEPWRSATACHGCGHPYDRATLGPTGCPNCEGETV